MNLTTCGDYELELLRNYYLNKYLEKYYSEYKSNLVKVIENNKKL